MRLMRKFWLVMWDLRTLFLATFNPRYIEENIKKRKGICPEGCVECCIVNDRMCEHLKDKKCNIYENRPQNCKDFPFDRWDMWIFKRIQPDAKCNFRWD